MLAQAPSAQPGEGRRPEGWAWPSVTASSLNRHMASLATLPRLTTRPSTSVRTRSPISGEMSLPNCCRVVRNRLSLLSCRAPQAGGRCCVDSEAVDEVAGPLLKPLGVDGVPLMAVGEWLLPFITVGEGGGGDEEHSRELQAPRYSHRDITRVPTPITDAQNRAWKGVCLTQGLSGWSLHGQTLHTPGVCHSPHVAWQMPTCQPGCSVSTVNRQRGFSTTRDLPVYFSSSRERSLIHLRD